MIGRTSKHMKRRLLIVDDKLAHPGTAGARAVRELADELDRRDIEVVEAVTFADGEAVVVSDATIDCIFVSWNLGGNDEKSHEQAVRLLREIRRRNATIPVFLLADQVIRHTVTVEVMQLADESVWMLEDTAPLIAGRAVAAIRRYLENLVPPFTKALVRYNDVREYSWAAPGHQGGVAFTKSPGGSAALRLLRREPVPHRYRHRARRARLTARPFGPHRGIGEVRGAHLRRAPQLPRPGRDLRFQPHHLRRRGGRERDRALRPQLPQVDRAEPDPLRRDPGLLYAHAQPLRDHRADPAAAVRAARDPEEDRRAPAPQAGGERRAGVRRRHQLHLRRHVLRRRAGREAARQERRPHPLRRGVVRLRALQSDVRRPVCHARRPGGPSQEGSDGLRDPLDPQIAGGALAVLVHPHPQRPRPDRSSPLQRVLLHAGDHLAALRDHRVQRDRRGDDGRARRPGDDPGGDRRGHPLPPGPGSLPPGARARRASGSSGPGTRRR